MKKEKKMAEYSYYHTVTYYHPLRLNIEVLHISVTDSPLANGGHLFFKMSISPSNY